jgi:hypothetical protein
MEPENYPLSAFRPSGAGIFQAWGSFDLMEFGQERGR